MITIYLNNEKINLELANPTKLSEFLFQQNLFSNRALCTGFGLCGKCKIKFLQNAPKATTKDSMFFSSSMLQQGWRLACNHQTQQNAVIEIIDEKIPQNAVMSQISEHEPIALDIGTTSIKWAEIDSSGNPKIIFSALNAQAGAGYDIMSRLAYIQKGSKQRKHLQNILIEQLKTILGNTDRVLTITANTTMLQILLGLDCTKLMSFPYSNIYHGDKIEKLPELPAAYIPPIIGPFLGSDIFCGLTWIIHTQDKHIYPFILADLGTNGEFILAINPNQFIGLSIPMGPALEGGCLSHGAVAGDKAITAFQFDQTGLKPICLSKQPIGISGSGYLSIIAILRRLDILSATGQINKPNNLIGEKIYNKIIQNDNSLKLTDKFYLHAMDIEEILKIKAAFHYALDTLLEYANLNFEALNNLFLAGSLGQFIALKDLEILGFIPKNIEQKIKSVGNTALKGAALLTIQTNLRKKFAPLAKNVKIIEINNMPNFHKSFISKMNFSQK